MTNFCLGIDFDNTIVSYDALMHAAALQQGLITADVQKSKKVIRDSIRQLPEGEIKWQKLQSYVYGQGMIHAQIIKGVEDVFKFCHNSGVNVYIVSHKTQYASMDKEENVNLRDKALDWMEKNNFFKEDGLGISLEHIFFEPTRHDKIERIKKLGCTHFVDDLEETFLEETFPSHVERILFTPNNEQTSLKNIKKFETWEQINDYLFASQRVS